LTIIKWLSFAHNSNTFSETFVTQIKMHKQTQYDTHNIMTHYFTI